MRSALTSKNLEYQRRASNFSKESHNSQLGRLPEITRMSDNAKGKMTKTPAEHPKYEEMIKTAIRTLKDRNGSSRQAIEKYVKANYKVGDTASEILFGVEQNNYPQGTNKTLKKLTSRCYLPSIISVHKH